MQKTEVHRGELRDRLVCESGVRSLSLLETSKTNFICQRIPATSQESGSVL